MRPAPGPWKARITIPRPTPAAAERLLRALGPEASREVPRARSRLERPDPRTVTIDVEARDTGALRAALNTFLGWVQLEVATEAVARGAGPSEALI